MGFNVLYLIKRGVSGNLDYMKERKLYQHLNGDTTSLFQLNSISYINNAFYQSFFMSLTPHFIC